MTRSIRAAILSGFLWLIVPGPALGQVTEHVGPRAPGMAGAFVAVADDSSATVWNPAGLAAGAFFDLSLGGGTDATMFSAGIPPFGVHYVRFRAPVDPTAGPAADREDGRARDPLRASQLGVTLVQTLVDGVHAGATFRLVRGATLTGGSAGTGDLDVGLLAVRGALRVGGLVRNVRAARAGDLLLDRAVRVGVAFDAGMAGHWPGIVALDVDLREYQGDAGPRQVIAAGAERWFGARRAAVRGGARTNIAPGGEAAVTGGASLALRPGFFVDGHLAVGGDAEQGWGIAGRVAF